MTGYDHLVNFDDVKARLRAGRSKKKIKKDEKRAKEIREAWTNGYWLAYDDLEQDVLNHSWTCEDDRDYTLSLFNVSDRPTKGRI